MTTPCHDDISRGNIKGWTNESHLRKKRNNVIVDFELTFLSAYADTAFGVWLQDRELIGIRVEADVGRQSNVHSAHSQSSPLSFLRDD